MTGGESLSQAELAFPGDGEMARRMRAYPWERSPLGDPRDWPASLRTACRICLTSRFPMIVWWGETCASSTTTPTCRCSATSTRR